MHAKFIRYSKTHRHIYRYDEDTRMWVFVACQLTGDMDRCTGGRKPVSAGMSPASE
jgi:hypothetical protein